MNLHQEPGINRVLPKELECYDFASGDISKIFASVGLMGKPSENLITAISEYDGDKTTYSFLRKYLDIQHIINTLAFENPQEISDVKSLLNVNIS